MSARILDRIWSAVWPARCPVCSALSETADNFGLCPDCRNTIKPLVDPVCKLCGKSLPKETGPVTGVCGFCQKDPPRFDLARGYADYQGALSRMIKDFKFQGQRKVVRTLCGFIVEADNHLPEGIEVDAVIPVPLHFSRLRERGFNQAVDLAQAVAKKRGVPVMLEALIRTRATEPQFGLSAPKRKDNIKGAFEVRDRERIKGGRLLIVDDIITTGATVNECARALKKAGAKKVYAVAVASTL